MASRRSRRPTAWEVSFPGESEDENKDEEIEPKSEREEEELVVLKSKRKTHSIVDERVRNLSLLSLSWFICTWNVIAGETSQSGAPAAVPGRWGRETGWG